MLREIFLKNSKQKNIDRKPHLINKEAPFHYVEAYKSLRTNIDFIASTNHYRNIMITSATPGDGKSTTAINLAATMADSGKHIILIDCDLRKGFLSTYLKISRSAFGITEILSGKKTIEEVVFHHADLNIDVLPVGTFPVNPSELIGSSEMLDLIRSLSEQYDYTLIDTPPVSVVTDAVVLGRFVDSVLLVARTDHTTKQALNISRQYLEDVNANILGTVLNGYDAKKYSYYQDGGYYDSYESYGADQS